MSGSNKPSNMLIASSQAQGWHDLHLDEQRQLPGMCESRVGHTDHLLIVQLSDLLCCARRWAGQIQERPLQAGALSLMPAGVPHHWRWDNPSHSIHLAINAALVTEIATAWDVDSTRLQLLDNLLDFCDHFLWHLVSSLRWEVYLEGIRGRFYSEEIAQRLAAHLLLYYSNFSHRTLPPAGYLSQNRLNTALEYIEAHLHESISLAELAGIVGVDRFWFAKMFQRTIGSTPHQYVIERRVEAAKTLGRVLKLLGTIGSSTNAP